MALPIFQRTIVNDTGDIQSGAQIEVFDESTGLNATLYSDRAGTVPLTNPFFTGSDGLAQFYAAPGEYRITSSGVAGTVTWRYVAMVNELAVSGSPYIIVASGQSNMDGAGEGGTMPAETNGVQMFDLDTRLFRDLSYSNRINRTNVNDGGAATIPGAANYNNLAFSFCHELHKQTGQKVNLIIVSNGGCHIGRWMGTEAEDISEFSGGWGGVGVEKPLYVELKAAVDDALVLLGASKIDAFLWHQGETARPNHEDLDSYKADFATFKGQLEGESWWDSSTQFIAGELVIGSRFDQYQEFYRSFNSNGEAYEKTTSGLGLTAQVESNPTIKIHYNGEGLYEIGKRYYRAFIGDRSAMADRFDGETTLYSARPKLYQIDGLYTDVVRIDPLEGRVLENKGIAPVRAGGSFEAGQIVSNPSACTVIHNDDGTFDVSPVSTVYADWTFEIDDYWIEGPAVTSTSVIRGQVSDKFNEKIKLWIEAPISEEATINLSMVPYLVSGTLADELITIDWGDGTVDTNLSTGNNSHTYAAPYTGYVTIIAPESSHLTTLILPKGTWKFSVADIEVLKGLTYFAVTSTTNAVFGDLSRLPDTVGAVDIQGNNAVTWDFGGLPALATLNCRGINTIKAYKGRAWAGDVPFKSLIVGGVDLTSTELDNILIALQDIKEGASPFTIYLAFGTNPRTAASDSAVTALQGKGFTVTTP